MCTARRKARPSAEGMCWRMCEAAESIKASTEYNTQKNHRQTTGSGSLFYEKIYPIRFST